MRRSSAKSTGVSIPAREEPGMSVREGNGFAINEKEGGKDMKSLTEGETFDGGKQPKGFLVHNLIAGFMVLAFISFFGWFARSALFAPSLEGYDEAPCEVEKSGVVMKAHDRFVFTAVFSYEQGGRRYSSSWLDKPGNGEFVFDRLERRLPLLEKFAPGTRHVCMVDANAPGDAVLKVSSRSDDLMSRAGRCFFAIFLAIFASVGVSLAATAFPGVRKVLTKKTKKIFIALFMMLFSLPFTGIGTYGVLDALGDFKLEKDCRKVSAKVLYSGVVSRTSGGRHHHTTHSPRIGYEYEIDGKKYESDRYSNASAGSGDRAAQSAIAASYKPGDVIEVFVARDNPGMSFIKRMEDVSLPWMQIAMPGIFALVGCGIFLGAAATLVFALFRREEEAAAFRPRRLKRKKGEAAFLCVFAVLWNAIAWTAGAAAFGGGFRPEQLIVAIFPCVGIGLAIGAVCKVVRELRAPGLELTLTLPSPSFAQVDWRLEDAENAESFEIALVGSRVIGAGKHAHTVVEKTKTLCRHERPSIPAIWKLGFDLPDREDGEDLTWALVAKIKTPASAKPYEYEYALA